MSKKENLYFDEETNGQEEILSIGDIVYAFKKRWWIVLFMTLISGVAGHFYVKDKPLMYQSSTVLMIEMNGYSAASNKLEMLRNMPTYVEVARSDVTLERVISKYNAGISLSYLKSSINVEPIRETDFIRITYTNLDPSMTAIIADEISYQFINRVREIYHTENIRVLEKAKNPRGPISGDNIKMLLIFIGIGFALGTISILTLEIFKRKVRNPLDIEKFMGVEIIGSIPEFKMKK